MVAHAHKVKKAVPAPRHAKKPKHKSAVHKAAVKPHHTVVHKKK